MEITKDVTAVNAIVNHPDMERKEYHDLTNFMAHDKNIVFISDTGCLIFHCWYPGTFEVHSQFVKKGRGKNALRECRDAVGKMFAEHECDKIVTRVPIDNLAALGLTRLMKFKFDFAQNDTEFYSLDKKDWENK